LNPGSDEWCFPPLGSCTSHVPCASESFTLTCREDESLFQI
jgi:hypothetical protein